MSEPTATPAANPTVETPSVTMSEAELEKATNELLGQEGIPQLMNPQEEVSTEEAAPETPEAATPEVKPEGSQADLSDEEKNLLNELRAMKEISGTPFKSPSDLVKAYKELQGTYTREHEFVTKAKPLEQLIANAANDPNFQQFLGQAAMLYQNPNLASAYVGQTGKVDSPPDPRSYNMYDDTDLARYQKDLADFSARSVDSRINARLSSIEASAKLDKMKSELKQVFAESNPDELVQWVQSKGNNWNLVDAYKVKEFDNIRTKAMEDARKELNNKLEQANRTTPPVATAGAKPQVKVDDIIAYIGRYGGEAARKKFGDANFNKALADSSLAM